MKRRALPKLKTPAALKEARRQLAETQRLLKRMDAERRRGIAANRRLFKELTKRRYRAMLRIEKSLGTYKPASRKLTASRRKGIRRAWKSTSELLARRMFGTPKRPRKSKKRIGLFGVSSTKRRRKSQRTERHRKTIHKGTGRERARKQPINRAYKRPKSGIRSQKPPAAPIDDHRLQVALRLLQKGKSVTDVAREIGVPREQLKKRLDDSPFIIKRGRRWVVKHDAPRQFLIYTDGRELLITVDDEDEASNLGKYLDAVKKFLSTNDPDSLAPFAGENTTDIAGHTYALETDPNELYRLTLTGTETFEDVYRIAV